MENKGRGERAVTGRGGFDSPGEAVRIRLGLPVDLPAISYIEAQSFSNPWQPDTFRSLLSRDGVRFLVAEEDGNVVGYAVLWWVLDQGELANLAVEEHSQGRGIGSTLLDRAISHAEAVGIESFFLEVRASNRRALRLYSSRGFNQISVRKDYYQNPREDARVLVKYLEPGSSAHGAGNSSGTGGDATDHTVKVS